MKVPVSWLRDLVRLPDEVTTAQIAEKFTSVGLTVEHISEIGSPVSGPLVVGRVLSFVEEAQKNGKVIRYCRVDVGEEYNEPENDEYPASRGIVCGARNFSADDLVVVALPGAVLPGNFVISARKTYGHISDGMICAEDEIGLGDNHEGIMVIQSGIPGEDAIGLLWKPDEVLELDVTPDLGYCLSLRGLAREAAIALGGSFTDPYRAHAGEENTGHEVVLDSELCSAFSAITIESADPQASTPKFIVDRLRASGVRAISLAVDVTNYVMLESGQPLHAYDADKVVGPIRVRLAQPGEQLVTLDGQNRELTDEDLVISDDSGAIGLAGVMGGERTEVSAQTTRIILEGAAFNPVAVSRTSRRLGLFSEAAKRFERTVDPALNYSAARHAAKLITKYGGGTINGETFTGEPPERKIIRLRSGLISAVLGADVTQDETVRLLSASGVGVTVLGDSLTLEIPSWRNDLVEPYDVVEEVGRKFGYDRIGKRLPTTGGSGGLTLRQSAFRDVIRAVVDLGFTQSMTLPFISADDLEKLGLSSEDPRRKTVRLSNPLSDAQPFLRSSLLPGLFRAVATNLSRSITDVAIFEVGAIFKAQKPKAAPRPEVTHRPSDEELLEIDSALPAQPKHVAAVVSGNWVPAGWHGPAVPADWRHVVALAESAAAAVGVRVERRQRSDAMPWHPGRSAELLVNGSFLGLVGELHPKVLAAYGLPPRTCAVEFDLEILLDAAPHSGRVGVLHSFPVAKEDVALIVDEQVSAADVRDALIAGGGELLESVRLFDSYVGDQVGEGKKSLAFALQIRADRTLTDAEAAEVRQAAVSAAVQRCGAVHRA